METDQLGSSGNLVLDLPTHCKYSVFCSLNKLRLHLNQSIFEVYRTFCLDKTLNKAG